MIVIDGAQSNTTQPPLAAMFRARKEIFVDLLGWDVPVIDGQYEIDEFDTERATYVVLSDPDGNHLGSARLLPTEGPHLLETHFPDLCDEAAPVGPDAMEISRFCLSRKHSAAERRLVRDRLVSALTDVALDRGIRTYVGIAEMGWLQQILAFGWRCRPLGLPRPCVGRLIGALRIEIDENTPGLLARAGVYAGRQAARFEPLAA
jgi:N-acyl-L-homoserine lactone synthetase